MYPFSPFGWWAVCGVTCFPCGEVIKSWETVMCLDYFALVVLVFRGLWHLWSHLKQDELGCKMSMPSQSQTWAAPNSVLEVARNPTEQAAGLGGVALKQSNLFPPPAQPWLSSTWIFGNFHLLWRAGTLININQCCPALGWFCVRSWCKCQGTTMTGWPGVPDLAVPFLHPWCAWDGIIIPCWG